MKLETLFAQATKLDTYTQLSIFGSWAFSINAACINAALRFVPEAPVNTGIEELTPYEAARRALIKEADTSNLPALLALQRELVGFIHEADGNTRGLEDTLAFMTKNGPSREKFGKDFDKRVRLGMRPAMTRRQFIDYEFERATASHNALIARGEDALRLCETITVAEDRGYNDAPDWVAESFERKLIEKCQTRWETLEMVRTDPRRQKTIRDAAHADQMLIDQLLATYGITTGVSSYDDHPDPSDIATLREEAFKSLADMPNDDPTAPGPVTITRFQRAPAPTA